MPGTDEELREALLATFRDEADELLSAITDDLIALERGGEVIDPAVSESIYRRTHSLKGAARAVSIREIESICQHLETALASVRHGTFAPDAVSYDLFHRAFGQIRRVVDGEKVSPVGIIRELRSLTSSKPKTTGEKEEPPVRSEIPHIRESDTVRIANKSLDRLIAGSDELLMARLSMAHRIREMDAMMLQFTLWQWEHIQIVTDHRRIEDLIHSGREISVQDLRSLDRILHFLKKNREFIDTLRYGLTAQMQANTRDRAALESSTQMIAGAIHDAVLLPFSHIFNQFHGFIREVAGSSGKQVDFVVDGGEIEIDRRVLEALKDPLLHLIRNAIDHGVEHPGARITRGKNPKGRIHVRVVPLAGSRVGVDVSDDGNGIDPAAIRKSAVQLGLIRSDEAETLSDKDSLDLTLRSGLSTSPVVTKLSGRGLGLAIVEEVAIRLGGSVSVTSIPGQNTCVRMLVPVHHANFRGVVVRSGRRAYVIPMQQVRTVIRTRPGTDDLRLDDELIRLIPLERALGADEQAPYPDDGRFRPVVILTSGAGRLGVFVDEIVRVQEIVVRALGSQLPYVKRITGAGILDDGSIALVIDALDLITSSLLRKVPEEILPKRESGRVLVVEDSVTSRELLRSILENAGYDVMTANDGAEALQRLKDEEYDIVISDVDMPRINGFALTEAIRTDTTLSRLPVVLVTSLDAPGDQEYGIHIGADAYIIKSTFEKEAFLKVVREVIRNDT